jgi:nucleotide-binding universal stress UspA family protein
VDTPFTPSQQTGTQSDSQTEEHRAGRTIVVGLDGRGRSASALVWAVEEAERGDATLVLVSARPEKTHDRELDAEHDLGALARRLSLADIARKQVEAEPVGALLDAAAEGDLLVVGCRSMHPAKRMMLGSTSTAVARWAPVPVIVVPEAWIQPSMASAPIVAGVRPVEVDDAPGSTPKDHEVLDFAFARADALKVPLAVISGWEMPPLTAWSPEDIERYRAEHTEMLERCLVPWRRSYPNVETSVHCVAEKPDHALLEASRVAQLVVMGRHHADVLSGLLGSTARFMLSHASRPVAVIPAGTRDELLRDLYVHRSLAERPWAPII